MINVSESVVELDGVLYKFRKRLRPANVGAASLKLAHLYRYEQAPKYSLKVRRMASELQKYVETFTDRLALTQVSNVVRGLSAVGHRLPPELLVRLAAGVLAAGAGPGGAAVRLAPDVDIRDLCYGFAGQGYTNPLFWSRLCSAVQPRLATFNPNTLPAIVQSLQAAQQLKPPPSPGVAATAAAAPSTSVAAVSGSGGDDAATAAAAASSPQVAVARDALRLLSVSLERLQPTRLADTAQLLATVGLQLGVGVEPELLGRLEAMALRALPSLASTPGHLANLLLGLRKLGSRAAAASLPASPSPASPTSTPLQPPHKRPNPHHLSPEVVAAAVPHLRAAAPAMHLIHIKRAVEALAPSALAPATSTAKGDDALPALLDLLARRATALLPPTPPTPPRTAGAAAGGPRPWELSHGLLARIPRGGKDAGLALMVAAGPGMTRLDESLLGVLSGLAHAYALLALAPHASAAAAIQGQAASAGDPAAAAAAAAAGGGEGSASSAATAGEDAAAAAAAAASWKALRREQYPGVEALFERVAELAVAGHQAGLLVPEQAAALGVHLSVLLPGPPPRRAELVAALSGVWDGEGPATTAVAGATT